MSACGPKQRAEGQPGMSASVVRTSQALRAHGHRGRRKAAQRARGGRATRKGLGQRFTAPRTSQRRPTAGWMPGYRTPDRSRQRSGLPFTRSNVFKALEQIALRHSYKPGCAAVHCSDDLHPLLALSADALRRVARCPARDMGRRLADRRTQCAGYQRRPARGIGQGAGSAFVTGGKSRLASMLAVGCVCAAN
jgi:hypothetical protein